jgi:protein phosphatase
VTQSETPIPAPPAGAEEPRAPDTAGAAGGSSPAGAGGSVDVRVKLFARTDVGQVREHNEDNFLVADLTKKSRGLVEANRPAAIRGHGALFAVCDGMGGAAAGEIASQLAVDILYERMIEGLDQKPESGRDEIARRLVRAVETAGQRIFQEAKADRTRRGMGTTVTAAALVDNHIFFAQVGDSRGYILRGDALTQITRDQSLVNQLIEAGQLTEEEAETFEHNNIILQALGTSETVQVDLTYAELRRGDMLLLCSDGLSGMVRSSSEPIDICKSLTERANQAGGHDNITVIIVQFDGEGLSPLASNGEPLKYKKYTLPEEPPENTEPDRRLSPSLPALAGASGVAPTDVAADSPGAAKAASMRPPGGVPSTAPSSGRPSGPASGTPGSAVLGAATWQERGPHSAVDDRISIPGTHVPAWIVVMIVLGVVALLASTAFFLLR